MNNKAEFPEGSIQNIKGKCIALKGNDIDTDRIIPARFLKCVSFEELGEHVFCDDRKELNGLHPFDQKINQSAKILIVNKNFGCGSSREHAPQALMRWGIHAIIGESFAEIFFGNCLALGIPCARGSSKLINELQGILGSNKSSEWELNLIKKTIKNESNSWEVKFEPGQYQMLISGEWDGTSQLIANSDQISKLIRSLPYMNDYLV